MDNIVSGEYTLEKITTFKWIKSFNKDREDCKNNERSGCPPTSYDHKNIELMRSNVISNDYLDNSWWAKHLKIIHAHNSDLWIVIEKLICQKIGEE